jgi:hypothetical protein
MRAFQQLDYLPTKSQFTLPFGSCTRFTRDKERGDLRVSCVSGKRKVVQIPPKRTSAGVQAR